MAREEILGYAIGEIRECPFNPRKKYDEAALQELADSVKEMGVMQPIVIRPVPDGQADLMARFEIVYGHRRFRAAQRADLDEVPCILRPMSDREAAIAQAHENGKREDVTPFEDADMYAHLMREHGMSAEQVGKEVGCSRAQVYARLKLHNAADVVRDAFNAKGLSTEIAQELAKIPNHKQQAEALKKVRSYDGQGWLSTRDAKQTLKRGYVIDLAAAPFDLGDAQLNKDAGSCHDCPKLNLNDPALAGEAGTFCFDQACHDSKVEAHRQRVIAYLRADGHDVLEGEAAAAFRPHYWSTPKGHQSLTTSYLFKGIHHKIDDLARNWPKDHPRAKLIYVAEDERPIAGYIRQEDLEELFIALGLRARSDATEGEEADRRDPMEGWSEHERLAADSAVMTTAFTSVMRRMLSLPRTIEEMRAMALRELEMAGEFGLVGTILGTDEDPPEGTPAAVDDDGDEMYGTAERYWIDHATGQQLGALFAGMALDDVLRNYIRPHDKHARLQAQRKLALLERYGVNILDCRPEADDPYADEGTPSKAARAQDESAAKPVVEPVQTEIAGLDATACTVDEAATAGATPSKAALARTSAPVKAKAGRYLNKATGAKWNGRGLQPAWMKAAIAGGAKLSDFLVDEEQSQAASGGRDDEGAGSAVDASLTTPATAGAKRVKEAA